MSSTKYRRRFIRITVKVPGDFYLYYLETTYSYHSTKFCRIAIPLGSIIICIVYLLIKYSLLSPSDILALILIVEIIPLIIAKIVYVYRLNKDLEEIRLNINVSQAQYCLNGNRIKYLKREMLNIDKNIADITIMMLFTTLIIPFTKQMIILLSFIRLIIIALLIVLLFVILILHLFFLDSLKLLIIHIIPIILIAIPLAIIITTEELQFFPIVNDLLNTYLNIEIIQKGVITLTIIYATYLLPLYWYIIQYLLCKLPYPSRLYIMNKLKSLLSFNNRKALERSVQDPSSLQKKSEKVEKLNKRALYSIIVSKLWPQIQKIPEKIRRDFKQKIRKGRERVVMCLDEILLTTYRVESEETFIVETRSLRESYRARSEEHRMLDSGFKKEQNQTR